MTIAVFGFGVIVGFMAALPVTVVCGFFWLRKMWRELVPQFKQKLEDHDIKAAEALFDGCTFAPIACPKCGEQLAIIGTPKRRACLNCGHTWAASSGEEVIQ